MLSAEPDTSDDDELDTDVDVNNLGSAQAHSNNQRTRDKATRDPPQSAPPAFASTSSTVGDNSRSQMKRKESESPFTSKKRARYVQAAHSDQEDGMNLDLDEHAKNKRHIRKSKETAPGMSSYILFEGMS
jgi:hypothetical protein